MHRCGRHRCMYSPNTSAGSSWAPGSYGRRRKPPPPRVPGKPRPFRSAAPLPTGRLEATGSDWQSLEVTWSDWMSLEVTGLESSRRPASHPRDLQAIARNAREWERLNAPDASLATRTARRPPTPPTPPQDLCRRGPPRRGPRRLKSTAPGTYAAGAPVSTLRWRETPQGAGEPHDTPSHKRTRHNSSYVLRTSRLAAPGPHRVRHAGRFTGHSGPILPGGVFLAAHI